MNNKETIIKTGRSKPTKMKIKGLTQKQIQLLQNSKMPLSAFAGILGGWAMPGAVRFVNNRFAERDTDVDEEEIEEVELDEETGELYDYEVPTTVEFAGSVNDDMTFGEAFQAARDELSQGGFFTWKGQHYNTYNKEEWDSFSDEDRTEFFKLFQENTDFDKGEIEVHVDDKDSYHAEDGFVELDEIGTENEIVDGLNDGEAFGEEDNYGEDFEV